MRKVGINNNQSKATSYLNKLLNAADTAQKQGKYLALNKVLKEAKRLSNHIRETQANPFKSGLNNLNGQDHKKAIAELQWLKYQGAQKASNFNANDYIRVQGEIIE
jgi:hypothetical protein